MTETGSISKLVTQLRAGDHDAAVGLWRRYFDRMSQRGRQRLLGNARAADGEDAALTRLTPFAAICGGASSPRSSIATNCGGCWRYSPSARLGHNCDASEARSVAVTCVAPDWAAPAKVEQVGQRFVDPRGEMSEGLDVWCRELLSRLADETLERIAVLRLEGCTNQEIGEQLGIAERSVERKLARIRSIWRQD